MSRKVAILGGGRIGEALLSGLLSSGWRDPAEIVVTSRREERLPGAPEGYGGEATPHNAAALGGAGLVGVARKPPGLDLPPRGGGPPPPPGPTPRSGAPP